MLRFHGLMALLLAVSACGAADAPPRLPGAAFTGTKGIGVHNWFTWTRQSAPDRYVFPAFERQLGEVGGGEAAALRGAGFDFVRLTVDPGVFMTATGADRAQATAALVAGIERLQHAGLSVLVDLHASTAFQPQDGGGLKGVAAIQRGAGDPVARQFQATAAALAGELDRRYGAAHRLAFEPVNEPTLKCGDARWRAQQAALHRAIRAAAPRLTLVLNGSCYDNIDGLMALNPADYADTNTLFTFHFYEEFRFTHQGVQQGDPVQSASGGFPYPWNARPESDVRAEVDANLALAGADAATSDKVHDQLNRYLATHYDRGSIDTRMDQVARWAREHDIAPSRILMGEFGVDGAYGARPGSRADDRLRWIADTRKAAETRGFRWAFWLYRGNGSDGFALLPAAHGGDMDPAVLSALGLRVPAAAR